MSEPLLWGNLVHLSVNMWEDAPPRLAEELRFDEVLWRELTERMADSGFNLLVIDIGDGVAYESHPEIAVKNAWSPQRLREELSRLRGLGLEPIPKLNFSATHDAWLKVYARQVSTPVYYQVCTDLIAEVAQMFDRPRFFHLGMDEEDARHQLGLEYAVVRQRELWWHDLLYLAGTTRQQGCRPWVWSDYAWAHPEYYERMPKSILQSNWYYDTSFDGREDLRPRLLGKGEYYLAYLDLDEQGFEQVPTASTWRYPGNFYDTVRFCLDRLDRRRVLGFLQTTWLMTLTEHRETHLRAIEEVRRTRERIDQAV